MSEHVFVGFGFGPIQAGLFAKEAFQSGHFRRIVVAEIDRALVDAVRANAGTYHVNVAGADGIETLTIDNIEVLNPTDPADATVLREALVEATEIATCLPSVDFYRSGQGNDVASLVADGISRRKADATLVYAAENNNHAAEILRKAVTEASDVALPSRLQFLNTVIGKMSRVVTDPSEIRELNLAPIAPRMDRAFLVEAFNHILVTKANLPDFVPGINVFVEKADLLPFEEAKLYGHNAIHALLGFVATLKGYVKMTDLKDDAALMHVARGAFITESGGALIRKYASLGDALFTTTGYRHYAEDLLERMTNPYLGDTVARASRDVVRKLGLADRIFGTMAMALEHGIAPTQMALGALAGVALLPHTGAEGRLPNAIRAVDWRHMDEATLGRSLRWVWKGQGSPRAEDLVRITREAREPLIDLLNA